MGKALWSTMRTRKRTAVLFVAFACVAKVYGDRYPDFASLQRDQTLRGGRINPSQGGVDVKDLCQQGIFVSGNATSYLSSQACDYRVLTYQAKRWPDPCPSNCPPNNNKWLVAIHGGNIDKGTGPLTSFLGACTCSNLYIFEDCPNGIFTPSTAFDNLHITQEKFNEDYLVRNVKVQGHMVVWVHNYWEGSRLWANTGKAYICVAGSDSNFGAKFTAMKQAVENGGQLQQALGFNKPIYLIDARNVAAGAPCSGIFARGNALTMSFEFPRALNLAIEKDVRPGGPHKSARILCSMATTALK